LTYSFSPGPATTRERLDDHVDLVVDFGKLKSGQVGHPRIGVIVDRLVTMRIPVGGVMTVLERRRSPAGFHVRCELQTDSVDAQLIHQPVDQFLAIVGERGRIAFNLAYLGGSSQPSIS
jgi:hypothetical protein